MGFKQFLGVGAAGSLSVLYLEFRRSSRSRMGVERLGLMEHGDSRRNLQATTQNYKGISVVDLQLCLWMLLTSFR